MGVGGEQDTDLLNTSYRIILKTFYGIGNNIGGRFVEVTEPNRTYELLLLVGTPPVLDAEYGDYLGIPIYRGWKYGIQNPLPIKNSAIFRYGRYGQFRDMLEQRKYGSILLNSENDSGDDNKVSILRPVQINFVDSDGKKTLAKNTTVQNLSQYATSSLPYFDGEVKDRTDNPQLLQEIIEL